MAASSVTSLPCDFQVVSSQLFLISCGKNWHILPLDTKKYKNGRALIIRSVLYHQDKQNLGSYSQNCAALLLVFNIFSVKKGKESQVFSSWLPRETRLKCLAHDFTKAKLFCKHFAVAAQALAGLLAAPGWHRFAATLGPLPSCWWPRHHSSGGCFYWEKGPKQEKIISGM